MQYFYIFISLFYVNIHILLIIMFSMKLNQALKRHNNK